ncbi:hypothetical protein D1O30_05635 [Methylocystis hirsuta]|uniref:Uncharacterized protein n=1 Tax=Methylocystis hirsuta TaxID=369798 RepID=A0A3M9XLL0_9HYPH|nr:hypothetical protein D1O30_05635 [Methylocystis hirsuta]
MRRVDVAHAPSADVHDFAVGKGARRPVGEIVERHHAGGLAMNHLRLRRRGEPEIHRAAFIGFDMAEGNPAQPLDWHDRGQALRDARKQRTRPAMKQQRLVGVDEELVEGETGRRRDLRHIRRQTIDALGDFIDLRFHFTL